MIFISFFFFFQAEDGIRDLTVTGVQTCALPIWVADVNALGGMVRGYEVIPDPARLRARGVTLDQLRQALEANNRNDGAGRLDRGEEHTSELQSQSNLVCRLLLEKKKTQAVRCLHR